MKHYIYLHIKLTDGSPFYVGKGFDKRFSVKRCRSFHWNNIVKKHGFDTLFLEEGLSEEQANQLEQYWINRIGRKDLKNGPLVNFTNGGEGASGRPMSEKAKNALSKSNTNRPTSLSQKLIVGSRYKGKFGTLHNRSKAIICMKTGQIFGSISEASRELNIPVSTVHYQINKHFQFVKP